MDIANSSTKLYIADVTSAIIQFSGIAFFANRLGTAALGMFFLFEALLGMLSIPANFGLVRSIEKRISEGESEGTLFGTVIALKLIPISVILLAIWVFRARINDYVGGSVAIFLGIAIITREFANVMVYLLKGELRVAETAVLKVAKQATWLLTSLIFIFRGLDGKGLILGLILGYLIMLVWGATKVSIKPKMPSVEQAQSLVGFAKYNFIASIGGYFYNWMDILVIGFFLSQAHVGAYEIAWRVTALILLFSKSIGQSIFPVISHLHNENNNNRIESIIEETTTPSLVLVIPAIFGVLVIGKDLLEIIFNVEMPLVGLALVILMAEKLPQALHAILGRALQGIDLPNMAAKASLIAVISNLILNIILVPRYGILGAATATAISSTVNTILHALYLSKYIHIEIPVLNILGMILTSIIMAVVLSAFTVIIQIQTLSTLLSGILLAVGIYALLTLSIPNVREDLLVYINTIR